MAILWRQTAAQLIPELERFGKLSKGAALALKARILLRPWPWIAGGAVGLIVLFLPKKTSPLSYISTAHRDQWYGPIRFVPAPTEYDAEAISITNDFRKHIVRRTYPFLGAIDIHERAADSLARVMRDIEKKGWGKKIKRFNGSYVPRFVRGSRTNLSSHAYGTSIDINADENPQGSGPTQDQKDLAPIFEKHGWYWGDRFSTRDPMHFEFILQA